MSKVAETVGDKGLVIGEEGYKYRKERKLSEPVALD